LFLVSKKKNKLAFPEKHGLEPLLIFITVVL